MPFSHKNVSAKVAKTYTFVTEVIEISVEIASMGVEIAMSIAEVISMRASAIPTWMKRIQKTLASSDGSAGTKEMVNRIAVSSGNSVGVAIT